MDEPDEVDVSETLNTRDDNDYIEERKGLRSMLRVDIKHNDDLISINNVHLPSGQPNFARKVGYAFISNCRYNRPSNFIMIGDMNTLPNSWHVKYSHLIYTPGGVYSYMQENLRLYVYEYV